MIVCFDIDGVLTVDDEDHAEDMAGSYIYRRPRARARDLCARCYELGFYVLLFTGRREPQRRITEDWLHANGFHYHRLEMGKPAFTWIIDDRVLGVSVDGQLDALEEVIARERYGRDVVASLNAEKQRADKERRETGAGGEASARGEDTTETGRADARGGQEEAGGSRGAGGASSRAGLRERRLRDFDRSLWGLGSKLGIPGWPEGGGGASAEALEGSGGGTGSQEAQGARRGEERAQPGQGDQSTL